MKVLETIDPLKSRLATKVSLDRELMNIFPLSLEEHVSFTTLSEKLFSAIGSSAQPDSYLALGKVSDPFTNTSGIEMRKDYFELSYPLRIRLVFMAVMFFLIAVFSIFAKRFGSFSSFCSFFSVKSAAFCMFFCRLNAVEIRLDERV